MKVPFIFIFAHLISIQSSLFECNALLNNTAVEGVLERARRQSGGGSSNSGDRGGNIACDFGIGPRSSLCDFTNPNMSVLQWSASRGAFGNWLGGPSTDGTGDNQGGYAFFETSTIPSRLEGLNTESAMLESPRMSTTGALGKCLKFFYAASGLSADRLRVLLHPISEEERTMNATVDHRDDIVLWSSTEKGSTWKMTSQLYTFPLEHSIVFEAIPMKGDERQYRGYIAIDNVAVGEGRECTGHCTFDGGFCNWVQDDRDDFQWMLSRGSSNPKTGPIRDRSSQVFGGTAGGYAYIDSRYPRRPGDEARLFSPAMAATTDEGPLCFRFWTHMHGPGTGTLRVMRQMADEEVEIWRLSGPSGNQWYQGQVPVAAQEEFRLILSADIGSAGLGDIAIDDISLTAGVCPLLPQAAAEGSSDCTFEVDQCGWVNPGLRENLDDIDWERTTARDAKMPHVDHTLKTERGYIALLMYNEPQRSGDSAWLVSPAMMASEKAKCLTFWYYMDEPVSTTNGPQLGGLKVWLKYHEDTGAIKLTPLWSVNNAQGPQWIHGQTTVKMDKEHKIVFEGMWGGTRGGAIALDDITFIDSECEQMPTGSQVTTSDCDFTEGACSWSNTTSDMDNQQQWRTATLLSRPRGLPDHTFRTPTGYVYFDIFSPQGRRLSLRLVSPIAEPRREIQSACVTFWYAAMSPTESARLRIIRESVEDEDNEQDGEPNGNNEQVLWSLKASETDSARPTWRYGQVEVDATTRHRVLIEGSANNFGFALDDVKIIHTACRIRPMKANPRFRDEDDDDENVNKQN